MKIKNNDKNIHIDGELNMHHDHEDRGSFSSGFIMGTLIGATGFFLAKTEEGKEIRKNVSDKWGSIKKKLEDEGVITGDESTVVDFITQAKSKIFEVLGEEVPKRKRKKSVKKGRASKSGKSKSKTTDPAKSSKRRKKMFKGV